MELLVQKYLRSGKTLDQLKEEHSIKFSCDDGLCILNYDQLNSVKTNPLIMECRGLILAEGSWDIISMAFHRFFNYGEAEEQTKDFNFENAFALEKIDGSIISVFYWKGQWRMATRGTIYGTGEVGFLNMTFKDLFDKTVSQYPYFYGNLCATLGYVFELVSPENRVVKPYNKRELYLLTARNKDDDWKEMDYSHLVCIGKSLGVPMPKRVSFKKISDLVRLASGLKDLDEGFVCVDYTTRVNDSHFNRLKVKNPAYVAIAHLKESSSSSMRALMQLVMAGEQEEFLIHFEEFRPQVDKIAERYNLHVQSLEADVEQAKRFIADSGELSRKDYAAWAMKTENPGLMFQILDGNVTTYSGYIDAMIESKSPKLVAKQFLKTLKIKDIDFSQE